MDFLFRFAGRREELSAVRFDAANGAQMSGQADRMQERDSRIGQVLNRVGNAFFGGPSGNHQFGGLAFAALEGQAGVAEFEGEVQVFQRGQRFVDHHRLEHRDFPDVEPAAAQIAFARLLDVEDRVEDGRVALAQLAEPLHDVLRRFTLLVRVCSEPQPLQAQPRVLLASDGRDGKHSIQVPRQIVAAHLHFQAMQVFESYPLIEGNGQAVLRVVVGDLGFQQLVQPADQMKGVQGRRHRRQVVGDVFAGKRRAQIRRQVGRAMIRSVPRVTINARRIPPCIVQRAVHRRSRDERAQSRHGLGRALFVAQAHAHGFEFGLEAPENVDRVGKFRVLGHASAPPSHEFTHERFARGVFDDRRGPGPHVAHEDRAPPFAALTGPVFDFRPHVAKHRGVHHDSAELQRRPRRLPSEERREAHDPNIRIHARLFLAYRRRSASTGRGAHERRHRSVRLHT